MRASRLALAVAVTVAAQVALFPHLRGAGAVPDLGLLLGVAVAFREGPDIGAVVGFAAGLAFDLFLETPLGLSALAYALTAYGVGVVQAGMLRAPGWLGPVLGLASGLAGGLLFLGIGALVGVEALKGRRAFVTVGDAAVYDALLAPFVFALVDRVVLGQRRERASGWTVR